MEQPTLNGGPSASQFAISAKVAAISLGIVSVALLAALAVLVSLQNQSILNTVALTLAILAFLIQIVVFIAQSWMSHEQMLHAERLHSDSTLLLTRVQGAADESRYLVRDQLAPLIARGIRETRIEEKETGRDRSGFDERLAEKVEELITSAPAARPQPTAASPDSGEQPPAKAIKPARQHAVADQAIIDRMRTYPEASEGAEYLALLRSMSPTAPAQLQQYAEDELISRERGIGPGLWTEPVDFPFIKPLVDNGLIELTKTAQGGNQFHSLTPRGREVARLLTGAEQPPQYLLDSLSG